MGPWTSWTRTIPSGSDMRDVLSSESLPSSGWPQAPQNRAPAGRSARHNGQITALAAGGAIVCPQAPQNRAPSGSSSPQLEHETGTDLSSVAHPITSDCSGTSLAVLSPRWAGS